MMGQPPRKLVLIEEIDVRQSPAALSSVWSDTTSQTVIHRCHDAGLAVGIEQILA